MNPIKKELSILLHETLQKVLGNSRSPAELESCFEVPREEKFGDFTTHVVLKLAKEKKRLPRPLAEELAKGLQANLKKYSLHERIAKILVEGPGFINFYYTNQEIASVILRIKDDGENFGKPLIAHKKKILLEFVSANPTGPLTVAHGRQAALGDSLARILKFCGHSVAREYYNNDEGVQINTLGESTLLRLKQLEDNQMTAELPEIKVHDSRV